MSVDHPDDGLYGYLRRLRLTQEEMDTWAQRDPAGDEALDALFRCADMEEEDETL